jgi:hypothetical protein
LEFRLGRELEQTAIGGLFGYYIKEAGDLELDAVSNLEQDNLREARHAFLKKTGYLTPEQFLARLKHTRFMSSAEPKIVSTELQYPKLKFVVCQEHKYI